LLALKMFGDEYELQLAGSETRLLRLPRTWSAKDLVMQVLPADRQLRSVAISNTSVSGCDRAFDTLALGVSGPCRQRRVRIDLMTYSALRLARTRREAQQDESIHPSIISAGCGVCARSRTNRRVGSSGSRLSQRRADNDAQIGSAASSGYAGIYVGSAISTPKARDYVRHR
jgi:hypothetical protein